MANLKANGSCFNYGAVVGIERYALNNKKPSQDSMVLDGIKFDSIGNLIIYFRRRMNVHKMASTVMHKIHCCKVGFTVW